MTYPLQTVAAPVGRVLLSVMFILAGFGKVTAYAGTAGYMAAMGVPGALLPLVILLEVGGGIAILLGWQTRIAAFLLGGFTVLAGLIFHLLPSTGMEGMEAMTQQLMFQKNLAIAGGFALLYAFGPGAWSLDNRSGRAAQAA